MQFKSIIKEDPVKNLLKIVCTPFDDMNSLWHTWFIFPKNISQVIIAFCNFKMSPNFFCQCNDLHSSENILTRPAKFEYIFTILTAAL